MSSKWTGLTRPITAQAAEAEPEHERLFSRPARRPDPDVLALLDRAEAQKRLFRKRESAYEGTHQKIRKINA